MSVISISSLIIENIFKTLSNLALNRVRASALTRSKSRDSFTIYNTLETVLGRFYVYIYVCIMTRIHLPIYENLSHCEEDVSFSTN